MEHGTKWKDFNNGHHQNYSQYSNRKTYFSPSISVPPVNQGEFEGIVIDYLTCNPNNKIDSLTLFRNIQSCYRTYDNSVYVFKTFSINDAIEDLLKNNLIEAKEIYIGINRAYFITKIYEQELKKYKVLKSSIFSLKSSSLENYNMVSKLIANSYLKGNSKNFEDKENLYTNFYNKDNDIENMFLGKKTTEDNFDNYELMEIIKKDSKKSDENNDNEEIQKLIYHPSVKTLLTSENYKETVHSLNSNSNFNYYQVLENLKAKYGSSYLRPFCEHGTRQECAKHTKTECTKVHFKPIIKPHTEVSLGDCSYLDTCRHMDICKFIHYQIEDSESIPSNRRELILSGDNTNNILPSQWINCDIRNFDYSILGKFDVIMADPPWDIHMELPYGTLKDEELKDLPVAKLQDDGVIFLWVTGRATELARDCLEIWGYKRKEELVWIKTNQLQRLIRTGRTGHWLNHSKEHCLIGIKGNPKLNRNVDCDVLVSEVRETSRKPDEIYELIERMKPGGRKLELFARAHNRRQGWISLGNQLPGAYLVEEEIIKKFNQTYPEHKLDKETMEKNKISSTTLKEINKDSEENEEENVEDNVNNDLNDNQIDEMEDN